MTDEVDDFLAHYGVKGMKWGVHKNPRTTSDGREVASFGQRREMNKVAKGRQAARAQKQSDRRDKAIQKARSNVPTARANIKAAKKQYKNDKMVLGRVAAKELMNNNTKKDWKTVNKAAEYTAKEQRTQDLVNGLLTLGTVLANVR